MLKYKKLLLSILFENKNKVDLLEMIEDFFNHNDIVYKYYEDNEINNIKNYPDKTKEQKNKLIEYFFLKKEAKKKFDNICNELSFLEKENKQSLFDLYSIIHEKLKNNKELRKKIINWEDVYDYKYGSYLPSSYDQRRLFNSFVDILMFLHDKDLKSDPNYKDDFLEKLEELKDKHNKK